MSTYEAGNAEEKEVSHFVKVVGNWLWAPVVSILALSFLARLALEFDSVKEKMPEELPGLANLLVGRNFWAVFFITLAMAVFIRRVRVPQKNPKTARIGEYDVDLFRVFLSAFFVLYAYLTARGLVPLPDVPPRIDFRGVLCVTAGVVIAWQCLVCRYRLFLVATWLFMLWIAFPQIEKRLKFLEMMLEPSAIERTLSYGLGLVLIMLMTPRALETFDRSAEEYEPARPLLFRKGLPF